MNLKNILGVMLLTSLFACKNDIDINAPYKDVAIVYGFLDQNQGTQYIRIEKLYQNSSTQTTAEGAQYPDSLYFDSLYVKITNLATKTVYICQPIDTIAKDSGFFSSGRNTLFTTKLPKNDAASEVYELDIYYPKKDIHFTGKTTIVKDATIPVRNISLKLVPANHVFVYKFTTARNAYMYDLTIRYQYKEVNISDTSIYVIKNVDYSVAKTKEFLPSKEYTSVIGSSAYIDFLKSEIKQDDTKKRYTVGITYIAYGGSQAFQYMIDLSKPNLSIVQKNTTYSNIENGIGIFSSRNYMEAPMTIDPFTIDLLKQELPNF
jgi:hypothetical protein